MRVLVLVVLAACSTDIGPSAEGPCAGIEGNMYETATALSCGVGPNGPMTCIWHLSFDTANKFHWQHDTQTDETGTITCSGTMVTGGAYSGTFDLSAGTVTWQGQVYGLIR